MPFDVSFLHICGWRLVSHEEQTNRDPEQLMKGTDRECRTFNYHTQVAADLLNVRHSFCCLRLEIFTALCLYSCLWRLRCYRHVLRH